MSASDELEQPLVADEIQSAPASVTINVTINDELSAVLVAWLRARLGG